MPKLRPEIGKLGGKDSSPGGKSSAPRPEGWSNQNWLERGIGQDGVGVSAFGLFLQNSRLYPNFASKIGLGWAKPGPSFLLLFFSSSSSSSRLLLLLLHFLLLLVLAPRGLLTPSSPATRRLLTEASLPRGLQ